MWPPKTVRIQLDDQIYELTYPHSPSMRNVIGEIFERPEYPICLPQDYRPELIVDVGANIGAAALWFRHYYPHARIISFEPSKVVFEYLQQNASTIKNVQVENVGLFDSDKHMTLHVGEHHAAQSSIIAHDETGEDTEIVELVRASDRLQALSVDRISILKIDTEGCEVPILRDVCSWLDKIDAIYLEYHSESDRREIDQLLAEHFVLIHARVSRSDRGMMVFRSRKLA